MNYLCQFFTPVTTCPYLLCMLGFHCWLNNTLSVSHKKLAFSWIIFQTAVFHLHLFGCRGHHSWRSITQQATTMNGINSIRSFSCVSCHNKVKDLHQSTQKACCEQHVSKAAATQDAFRHSIQCKSPDFWRCSKP